MKVIINPSYSHLSTFVNQIPYFFEKEGIVIHNKRNIIKRYSYYGQLINVKKYKPSNRIGRFIYTFWRKSKARKAYTIASEMIDKGITTPQPIAYIELYNEYLIDTCYFVSQHCDYPKTMQAHYHGPVHGNEPLLQALAQYTANMHEAGIFHRDYAPGNILYQEESNKFAFSVIDLSQVSLKKVGLLKGYINCMNLFDDTETYLYFIRQYALARHRNPQLYRKIMTCCYYYFALTQQIKRLTYTKRKKDQPLP